MDVLVLAGGKCSDALREATGVEFRASLPVDGRPMVELVLGAVRHLGAPILVGGPEGLTKRHVPAGRSFVESLRAGLDAVETETFLLVTGDLPFLTRDAVDDFLNRADPSAMISYPIVPIAEAERAFPGVKRTAIKLREGRFTGGNLGLIRTDAMRSAMPTIEKAYAARKQPLRLAAIVGFGTLLRVALGQVIPVTLPLATLERAVGRFLGGPVRAIVTPYAEIGADVDDLEQYLAIDLRPDTEP